VADPFTGAPSNPGSKIIKSAQFVDAPITAAFNMISDQTGLTVVMSPALSEKPPKLNLWVKNLTADQLLDQIAQVAGLAIDRRGDAIQVMTFDEYAKTHGVEKQVIQLTHAKARDLVTILQPFLDAKESKVSADEAGNKLVLLQPSPMMASLVNLVKALDVPSEREAIRPIRLQHRDAAYIAPLLETFLTNGPTAAQAPTGPSTPVAPASPVAVPVPSGGEGATGRKPGEAWLVQFLVEPELNMIVLRGAREDVDNVAKLVTELDTPTDVQVVSYPLTFTKSTAAYDTLQELLGDDLNGTGSLSRGQGAGRSSFATFGTQGGRTSGAQNTTTRLKVAVSEQNNRIVVEGTPADQARVKAILDAVDRPLPPEAGSIRVYRLENAAAPEVAKVLQAMIDNQGQATGGSLGGTGGLTAGRASRSGAGPLGGAPGASGRATAPPAAAPATAAPSPAAGGGAGGTDAGSVYGEPVKIAEADEINAIILTASAAQQEEYGALIRQLDQPRDQVLIEVTLVSVQNSDGFNLGVQFGEGGKNAIGFTNFGVGNVDSTTGKVTLPLATAANPLAFGANFAIINADDFSLVLNAFQTIGKTRIVSSPKALVQDNATAQIQVIDQQPFSQVSQGNSSTVSGFGGFAEAGTSFAAVPHVSKDGTLRLDYQIELSSFATRTAQQSAANLPPPTHKNTTSGTVRVPNERIVVLGGLTSSQDDEVIDQVPFLGDVPLLGEAFKTRRRTRQNETLYIFIRPIILGDPAFRDLVYISQDDARRVALAKKDLPTNPLKLLGDEAAPQMESR
jgi:type II secretion system protein D